MTEPAPSYTPAPGDDAGRLPTMPPVGPFTPDLWLAYLQRRREALIMELRALDRVLGRPQTIPTRQR